MGAYFDSTKRKWVGRVSVNGRRHFAGLHATREQALAAADEIRAQLQPRQASRDEWLRAKALSTARVQFTGRSPQDLIDAAELLYQWLRNGTTTPRR